MHRAPLSLFIALILTSGLRTTAQTTRNVLFLGNSYTGVNNLPQVVKDLAISAGDTLTFDSHTPGGYTLEDHSADPTSENKIAAQTWDYVVLQGQSREPIIESLKFSQGAGVLYGLIREYHACAVPMFYMTWGRKNGDPTYCEAFPVMCTYEKMDSALRAEYLEVAERLNAEVSPVSAVWRYLRQNHPSIDLYQGDESHPSAAGSYAAACSFYAAIFKKDPTQALFNSTLSASDAAIIRSAAKAVVFDDLASWDYKRPPHAAFYYSIGSGVNEVAFSALDNGVKQNYLWDFGDGNNATPGYVQHSYAANGTYTVQLTASNCDLQGTYTDTKDTVIQFCDHTPTITTLNPWLCYHDTLWTQPADAYQWYTGSVPLPATEQSLPDYQQYGTSAFTVLATVDGCSELSRTFNETPDWSGYYFDAAFGGDPCEGDTALFITHHLSGSLDSAEIRWYRDSVLMDSLNNTDTLFIVEQGIYECRVSNPYSNCPKDTTYYGPLVFDCGDSSGTTNIPPSPSSQLKLYPNPASETISITLAGDIGQETLEVYSSTGSLRTIIRATPHREIRVSDWPAGLYYIRISNSDQPAIKLIKQ